MKILIYLKKINLNLNKIKPNSIKDFLDNLLRISKKFKYESDTIIKSEKGKKLPDNKFGNIDVLKLLQLHMNDIEGVVISTKCGQHLKLKTVWYFELHKLLTFFGIIMKTISTEENLRDVEGLLKDKILKDTRNLKKARSFVKEVLKI